MTKRKIEYWVIPPDQDAEFVADMENVLETYAEAYDPRHPVLCMDEQPVQLLKETKVPVAATKKHPERVRIPVASAIAPRRGEPEGRWHQTQSSPKRALRSCGERWLAAPQHPGKLDQVGLGDTFEQRHRGEECDAVRAARVVRHQGRASRTRARPRRRSR